jgi:hypothetical protein
MKFRVIYQPTARNAHSPARVVEQTTGRDIGWINRYLDREYVRRLGDKTLRLYAYNLLHFVRWRESIHHTGEVREMDLTESTLRDYLCSQSSLHPRPSGSTINDRTAIAESAHQSPYQDYDRSPKTFHTLRMGRDWPAMSATGQLSFTASVCPIRTPAEGSG